MRILALLAGGFGFGAGVAVTLHAHRDPITPWWSERVGSSRLRRSDLPVGGTLALASALLLATRGHRRLAGPVSALGIGAAVAAVGTGLLEPLPPA